MKKFTLLVTLLLFAVCSFAQKITRGPDVGEIYFLGPTHTGTGLYYSTDFGETAVCVDSVNFITSIAADKTPGGVYSVTMPVNLYYSDNYGYANSWVFRTGELDDNIKSGVTEGYIFSGCVLHSEDYGVNFFYHSLNGFFGNPINNAIDNVDDNIGYVITNKLTVADTVYLFRTVDKFENLELTDKLNNHWSDAIKLSRGFLSGELYFFNHTINELWFSNDFADSLELINNFNFNNYYQISSDGGRQEGELYVLYNFVNLMWMNAHIFIYHSIDYGQTFDVYHPFGKGNEPVLSNFSTLTKEVFLIEEVEFDNYSIGEIIEYQWDFDNNGTIDSYDEYPVYTYQDTGYYSVALTVVGQDSSNTFLRENYIHVIDTVTYIISNNEEYYDAILYPNPFSDNLKIEIRNNLKNQIEIYNNMGELIRKISSENQIVTWNGKNNNGQKCLSGIYYIKINNSIHKVLLTK